MFGPNVGEWEKQTNQQTAWDNVLSEIVYKSFCLSERWFQVGFVFSLAMFLDVVCNSASEEGSGLVSQHALLFLRGLGGSLSEHKASLALKPCQGHK